MEEIGSCQPVRAAKKGKKKDEKNELDRQKQAEKKKRRLAKALANSAAIISELEKKNMKKKEEQLRLDEEGIAIAEAVALHVLAEDTREIFGPSFYPSKFTSLPDDSESFIPRSTRGHPWASNMYSSTTEESSATWGILGRFQEPYPQENFQPASLCPGFLSGRSVSSLQIEEEPQSDALQRIRLLQL